MRIPRSLAWLLVVLTFFTAGLLRQFHDSTPLSPYVPPVVGSLLFAAVLFLLLVAARERRVGAVRGDGVRLGSLTPLLLMLLMEKWVSLGLYNPVFFFISPTGDSEAMLDARYRAFAAAGLLAVCLLVATFSPPARRRTWRRSRPSLWLPAALGTGIVIAATYMILWGGGRALGGEMRLWYPRIDLLWIWIVVGQSLRAFAEEAYYRGLLLFEMQRLAPRLGLRSAAARRWVALLLTSTLFGMEHIHMGASLEDTVRRLVFTFALGVLFGIIVLASGNIHFAAGVHVSINWLLLGVAPHFVGASGKPALAPGTYIGLSLVLAFVLVFLAALRRRRADGSS